MDPYSYGFNLATKTQQYMNASSIVKNLVDVVSKNGNYLLDIGPRGNGSIPEIEAQHLREAGKWIKNHGEAIFNTTSWFVTSQEGKDVRFTTTMDAFYVFVMNQLNSSLLLTSPVPWIAGDKVTVVGGNLHGTIVPSSFSMVGSQPLLRLDISDAVRRADKWVWVFKITYN